MDDRLRVLAVGSCRVFRPLRSLHARGLITLLNPRDGAWFTHSAGEAAQYVDVLAGRTQLPARLRPYICETPHPLAEDLRRPEFLEPDVTVVEVSTTKALRVGGLRLNAHKVHLLAEAAGFSPREVLGGQPVAWPQGEPLAELEVGRDTRDEVTANLCRLRDAVHGPVVTVDHLHARLPTGELPAPRQKLTAILRQVEADCDMPLFSTQPVIEAAGAEVALKNRNHWRADFEPRVGDALLPVLSAVASGAQRAALEPGD